MATQIGYSRPKSGFPHHIATRIHRDAGCDTIDVERIQIALSTLPNIEKVEPSKKFANEFTITLVSVDPSTQERSALKQAILEKIGGVFDEDVRIVSFDEIAPVKASSLRARELAA